MLKDLLKGNKTALKFTIVLLVVAFGFISPTCAFEKPIEDNVEEPVDDYARDLPDDPEPEPEVELTPTEKIIAMVKRYGLMAAIFVFYLYMQRRTAN